MPPSTASGATTWTDSGWQTRQWKGRRSGAAEGEAAEGAAWSDSGWQTKQWKDPWGQFTAGGWQGKWTSSWWDDDSWSADPPAGPSAEGRDGGGASDGERASDEQEEEPRPWEHCVGTSSGSKEDAVAEDDVQHATPTAARPPDADELRALHAEALRQFMMGDDCEPPGSDTEVAASGAAQPAPPTLPEVIPIHGADARCAFYNPTTGGVDCQLCAMHLNSLKQWEDHRTGKKHVKKLNNPKLANACEPPAPVAST